MGGLVPGYELRENPADEFELGSKVLRERPFTIQVANRAAEGLLHQHTQVCVSRRDDMEELPVQGDLLVRAGTCHPRHLQTLYTGRQ